MLGGFAYGVQVGFQGQEVAAFGGLEDGDGGVQAGQFGVHELQTEHLRCGFFGQLVDVVGFVVDGECCHDGLSGK